MQEESHKQRLQEMEAGWARRAAAEAGRKAEEAARAKAEASRKQSEAAKAAAAMREKAEAERRMEERVAESVRAAREAALAGVVEHPHTVRARGMVAAEVHKLRIGHGITKASKEKATKLLGGAGEGTCGMLCTMLCTSKRIGVDTRVVADGC